MYAVGRMPAPRQTRFGGPLEDVTEPFVDVLTSVRDRLPVEEAQRAFKDVVGFLGDAGEAVVAQVRDPKLLVLRVVSTMGWPAFLASFIPGVGPVMGGWLVQTLPISATAAERCFSGSARDAAECVGSQIAAEISWRLKMLSMYQEAQQVGEFVSTLQKIRTIPTLDARVDRAAFDRTVADLRRRGLTEAEAVKEAVRALHLSPSDLAEACAAAGGPCRQDAIAAYVNARLGRTVFDLSRFDLASGASLGILTDPTIPQNLSSAEYQQRLGDARLRFTPQHVIDELTRLLDVARAREEEATVPLAIRWRSAENRARAVPADGALRRRADDLRVAYEAASTPAERMRDAQAALAANRTERDMKARLRPPVPASVLARLDAEAHDLSTELRSRLRDTPIARGDVRVVLDPTPSDRLRQVGTLAILTSPLWGYAIYRHRAEIGAFLRGMVRR